MRLLPSTTGRSGRPKGRARRVADIGIVVAGYLALVGGGVAAAGALTRGHDEAPLVRTAPETTSSSAGAAVAPGAIKLPAPSIGTGDAPPLVTTTGAALTDAATTAGSSLPAQTGSTVGTAPPATGRGPATGAPPASATPPAAGTTAPPAASPPSAPGTQPPTTPPTTAPGTAPPPPTRPPRTPPTTRPPAPPPPVTQPPTTAPPPVTSPPTTPPPPDPAPTTAPTTTEPPPTTEPTTTAPPPPESSAPKPPKHKGDLVGTVVGAVEDIAAALFG